jgi:competence protein ComEC
MALMLWWGQQGKAPPFYLNQEQKNTNYVIGKIEKKEYKNEQIYVYLSKVSFLYPTSDVSKQLKTYQDNKSQIGCICYLQTTENLEEDVYPKIGASVLVEGMPMDFLPATNLGMFDQKEYYVKQGVHFGIYQAKIVAESEAYNHVLEGLFQLRQKIAGVLMKELGEKNGGILCAMLLGEKGELQSEIKEGYQYSGISHILAISGLHISILGFGLFKVLRRFQIPMLVVVFLCFFLLLMYGIMVGGSVATIRAIIMFTLFVVAKIIKHPYDIATSISVAGCVIIGMNTRNAGVGFFLSFGAIMGLVFVNPVLYELFPSWRTRKRKEIKKGVLSGVSILIMTIPILEVYYYGVAPLSVFVNILVIPLMSILIPSSIFLIVTSVSIPFLSFFFRISCECILWIYEKIIWVSEKIPGYFLVTGKIEWQRMVCYYLLLLIMLVFKKRMKRRGKILILWIMFAILIVQIQSNLQIQVLDVGQGDGIYIETGTGFSLFIDGGSTTVEKVGKYRIAPYLKAKGVTKIDYLFFTHYDQDHISGWVELFEEMLQSAQTRNLLKVTNIVISKETKDWEGGDYLLSLAHELDIAIYYIEKGDIMDFRGVSIQCIYPGEKLTESANENSLVLLLRKENFSMLFTGDLEGEGEMRVTEILKQLREEQFRESIEILKIGHHGSKHASSYEFLKEVQASVGILSYGIDNVYGHPDEETLERLQEENMLYFGTGEEGAILIESDGEKYWIKSHFNEKENGLRLLQVSDLW